MDLYSLIIFLVVGVIILLAFMYFVPVNLWITAVFSGVKIEIFELVFMRIRKVPPGVIVNNLIKLTKAGISVNTSDLETHYLAGGNIDNVTKGVIKAKTQGWPITFKEAAALDLSGSDIEYHLKKKNLEMESGVDKLRAQLSDIILNKLDTDQLKEITRTVEKMKLTG